MATTVRVQIDRKAIGQFLKGSQVQAMLRSHAQRIAANAGPGFEARSSVGRTRARSVVIATTTEARLAEATDRSLSRALGRG